MLQIMPTCMMTMSKSNISSLETTQAVGISLKLFEIIFGTDNESLSDLALHGVNLVCPLVTLLLIKVLDKNACRLWSQLTTVLSQKGETACTHLKVIKLEYYVPKGQ